MKIALVTFDFSAERYGGVNSVCLKILAALNNTMRCETEIISFANSKRNSNSVSLCDPKTFRNKRISSEGFFHGTPVTKIGSVGSEMEFMRYRKRRELTKFFNQFDLIIVVTGILQFANIIPKVAVPVFVQFATRLKWERKSQYSQMPKIKQFALRTQLPFLAFQELRVIRSRFQLLPENSMMHLWISKRSKREPLIWYPGLEAPQGYSQRSTDNLKKAPFISVGRFGDRRKGWARLIEAYKVAYKAKGKLPDLILIGSGELVDVDKRVLEEIQSQYPIRIYSNLSDAERDSLLCKASIFLQASFEEGLGIAAIEALSFGLPVLTSDTHGSREYVVNGSNGFLVPQGSAFVVDFAKALLRLYDSNLGEMSQKSREIFEEKFERRISESNLCTILSLPLA